MCVIAWNWHPASATPLLLLANRDAYYTHRTDDAQLPDTGIALEWERQLSAIWVVAPEYGTRTSSIVQWIRKAATFLEQTYGKQGVLHSGIFRFGLDRALLRSI